MKNLVTNGTQKAQTIEVTVSPRVLPEPDARGTPTSRPFKARVYFEDRRGTFRGTIEIQRVHDDASRIEIFLSAPIGRFCIFALYIQPDRSSHIARCVALCDHRSRSLF